MAKQVGPIKVVGCYGNICFYRMRGKYYARMKSSLTGKRVKKDPVFRLTMVYADLLARAAPIASAAYSTMAKEKGLYKKLTGRAIRLLKEGKTKEEVLFLLLPASHKQGIVKPSVRVVAQKGSIPFAEELLEGVFSLIPLNSMAEKNYTGQLPP